MFDLISFISAPGKQKRWDGMYRVIKRTNNAGYTSIISQSRAEYGWRDEDYHVSEQDAIEACQKQWDKLIKSKIVIAE